MKKAILSLLAGLLPWTAMASMPSIPTLQPETYKSPSAKWQLEVDPTHREGSGPGRYLMTREGKVVWQTELPITLNYAKVTDTGITVGYGYSHGEAGLGNNGPGTLNALLIDPTGSVLLDDAMPRQAGGIPGVWAEPTGNGLLMLPAEDRFILRLDSGPAEQWLTYQLSSGKKLDTFNLHETSQAPDSARYAIHATPLAGVPLVLVQWWYYSHDESGALFSIVDFKGRSVWSHSLPRDYSIPGDDDAEERLRDEIQRHGAILDVRDDGNFTIRHVAEGTQLNFKITRDASAETGWIVTRISSRPYTPPKNVEAPAPKIEPRQLKMIRSFQLEDRPVSGDIRSIREFDFDGEGRFGFLRQDPTSPMAFVLVDTQATVITEIPLPNQKQEKDTTTIHTAWLGGTRWIITTSTRAEGGNSSAWWLDVDKRSIERIGGFDSPSIEAISGTRDGGFVVIATHHQKYSSTDYIIGFDAAGKQRWKKDASINAKPESIISPEDITVTTRGEIAVLDNIRNQVKWFGLDGSLLRATELERAWNRKPNYPTGITPDSAGGIIIHDFNGKQPFVRMRPDDTVLIEFAPKHPDGRTIDADTGLNAAPDGTLWACDGDSFIQLSDQGVAVRDIGSRADDNKLGEITALAADREGSIYAMDRRTAAVHVFSPDGAKLRTCKPDKDDFTGNYLSPHLTVTNDGGVLVRMEEEDDIRNRYLAYGPDGTRNGIKRLSLDDITEEWYCQPGTGNTLVLGHEVAYLVDPADKLLRKIERQADRRWLGYLSGAAFAADGSFVINSNDHTGQDELSIYDPTGKPFTTIRPQSGESSILGGYNGRHITLYSDHVVHVIDREGKVIASTPKTEEHFTHLLVNGGKELWIIAHTSHTVTIYSMPE